MKSDFLIALTQLAAERNLPREMVLSAIEAALASAYRKDNLVGEENIAVRLSPTTGDVHVHVLKTVAEPVNDVRLEISLADAQKIKKDAVLGEVVETGSTPYSPGRIAAQTAKQVVMQRLREAERDLVYAEYANRAGEIITAMVQRADSRQVVVDLGRAEGIMPEKELIPTERYRPNLKVKVYIVEVARTARGPEIIVSRAHRDLIRRLFEIEVPEIFNGVVEIKTIAREAGARSKVAVWARQEGVDAVGSCVGMRGVRIQNVVQELQGEKIDVVQWHRDPATFIANALNPAQVAHVDLNSAENTARVVVQDKQLSLAIGKEGQNARLAAKLTGWKIDIISASDAEQERLARSAALVQQDEERRAKVLEGAVTLVPAEAAQAPVLLPQPEPQVLRPAAQQETQLAPTAVGAVPMPVAEAKERATRPVAAQGQPVMTAQEQEAWLLKSIADEEAAHAAQAEAEEEAERERAEEAEGVPITDDVWNVPVLVPSAGGQIRFAEDILGQRGGGRRGGRRGDGRDEDPNRARKGTAKRRRGPGQTEQRE
ncbi:MAG: transcription termination/antitermination protein NusA [Chloroflexi bacterium]|nr:transcription termination/antitermination protein NusA [Chloroflexota bacterium]